MDWRLFRRAFLVLLLVLLSLSRALLARRGFDRFLALQLALGSVAASLLLAYAFSGVHAVLRKWGRKEVCANDFVLPVLFLAGSGIWFAFAFRAPLLAGVLEVGLWLIVGGLLIARAASRWRRSQDGL